MAPTMGGHASTANATMPQTAPNRGREDVGVQGAGVRVGCGAGENPSRGRDGVCYYEEVYCRCRRDGLGGESKGGNAHLYDI
jgi:hypothetical protein